jgi:hypothetical protein
VGEGEGAKGRNGAGDATSTERLKPGANKSGNKIKPRRAEVFAPPIRGEPAGHGRSPSRPFAHAPFRLLSVTHPPAVAAQ